MHGLILYANIIHVNHTFLFVTPKVSVLDVLQKVLAVFIAWINLGIEFSMAWMLIFKHGCSLLSHFTIVRVNPAG